MNSTKFSRSLGWFSIGLGVAELLFPRKITRAIGVNENHDKLVRLAGLREISSGLGILARPKPSGWMWSRVVGDVMYLSLLGAAFSSLETRPFRVSGSSDSDRRRLIVAAVAVSALTVFDLLLSLRLTQKPRINPEWRYSPEGGRAGIARVRYPGRLPALSYPDPSVIE